eukprot:SAG31_NODE_12211_length_958_cov_1.802095_1_plen_160_part_00
MLRKRVTAPKGEYLGKWIQAQYDAKTNDRIGQRRFGVFERGRCSQQRAHHLTGEPRTVEDLDPAQLRAITARARGPAGLAGLTGAAAAAAAAAAAEQEKRSGVSEQSRAVALAREERLHAERAYAVQMAQEELGQKSGTKARKNRKNGHKKSSSVCILM